MRRVTTRGMWMVCLLSAAGCSGSPDTMLSPTGATATATFVNPDGSTVKVNAPGSLGPSGSVTVNTLRPTLSFTNPTGRFRTVGYSYDVEVQNANGTIVYSRTIGESSGSTSHGMEIDLSYSDNFFWRTRARLGDQVGPWSGFAQFRTLDRPAPPPPPPTPVPPTGGLPFPVPAACVGGNPSDRYPCAAAVAALSAEWGGCVAGSGTRCHRFTRQVAFAMAQSDPEWKLIQAAPGGNGCNCNQCGPSDGTWFREDTVVYQGNRVFDMILGAGAPGASLQWSAVPGPRPGDLPTSAPLCTP